MATAMATPPLAVPSSLVIISSSMPAASLKSLVCESAFCPVVADYYSGMLVSVALAAGQLAPAYASAEAVRALYADYYKGEALVAVHPAGEMPPDGTLAANALAGRDSLEIFVFGSGEYLLLAARFDNLGKGASGAAVQCMNLMLGLPELEGLVV